MFLAKGFDVVGTSRSKTNFSLIKSSGARPVKFDGSFSDEIIGEMKSVTHVIQSIAPGAQGDQVVQLLSKDLARSLPQLKWLSYLSTIGVYGDHQGAWVTEDTATQPMAARSKERVQAEQEWLALANQLRAPIAILRLAGIYGPGRNALLNVKAGTAQRIVKKDQIFNRIRVEDIARACEFLAAKNTGGVFNVADDEPAPPQDVIAEAAKLLKLPAPPDIPYEKAELSPMGRSFYSENKRASNARLKSLGFEFLFPNYRMSLAELISSGETNKA